MASVKASNYTCIHFSSVLSSAATTILLISNYWHSVITYMAITGIQ